MVRSRRRPFTFSNRGFVDGTTVLFQEAGLREVEDQLSWATRQVDPSLLPKNLALTGQNAWRYTHQCSAFGYRWRAVTPTTGRVAHPSSTAQRMT